MDSAAAKELLTEVEADMERLRVVASYLRTKVAPPNGKPSKKPNAIAAGGSFAKMTPGDAAVMNSSVADVPSAAAFRLAMSRSSGPGWYVIGPTQTGLVAIEAQNARSLPWKRTSGVCCA